MIKHLLLSGFAALALGAGAAPGQTVPDDLLTATILPGWRGPDGQQIAAIRFTLTPGWHTYWRSPGDAGVPPRFDWAGSANLRSVAYLWPAPEVIEQNGLRTLGFTGSLVLPLEVMPADDGQPVQLNGRIDLGVCETICVPVSVEVTGALSQSQDRDPAIQTAIAAAPEAGSSDVECAVEPIRDGLRLTASLDAGALSPDEFAVMELPGTEVWVSSPDTFRQGDRLTATADLVPPNAQTFALDRSQLRLTLFGGGRAVEYRGCHG
jgi:DsbC/DsbD-like thiol-disulfide interchange protein